MTKNLKNIKGLAGFIKGTGTAVKFFRQGAKPKLFATVIIFSHKL